MENIKLNYPDCVYRIQDTPFELSHVALWLKDHIQKNDHYNQQAKDNECELYNTDGLKKIIADCEESILLYVQSKEVKGVLISKFDCYTRWLSWIIVDEKYRHQGIAKILLQALDTVAVNTQCHKIWCDSRSDNEAALQLLTKNGFRVKTFLERHWYKQNFYLLEKKISDTIY